MECNVINKLNPFEHRRQKRIERRKQEILNAAAQVFAEKGYNTATTKEIADRAEIAEGTLYNYFGGKREILDAIVEEATAPMETALQEAGDMEDQQSMTAMLENALAISETHLPFTRTLLTEAWMNDAIMQDYLTVRLKRIHDQLTAYIKRHIATHTFRPIDPEVGARMVMGMFGALIIPAIRGILPPPTPEECHTLAETMVDFLMNGIYTGKGQSEFQGGLS